MVYHFLFISGFCGIHLVFCAGQNVGESGAIAIADALKHNSTLQILHLDREYSVTTMLASSILFDLLCENRVRD